MLKAEQNIVLVQYSMHPLFLCVSYWRFSYSGYVYHS